MSDLKARRKELLKQLHEKEALLEKERELFKAHEKELEEMRGRVWKVNGEVSSLKKALARLKPLTAAQLCALGECQVPGGIQRHRGAGNWTPFRNLQLKGLIKIEKVEGSIFNFIITATPEGVERYNEEIKSRPGLARD